MSSTQTFTVKSDLYFLHDLKNCGMMEIYHGDPEKQKVSLQIEQQFRNSFSQAASEAASLTVDPDDPYMDIYDRLGLKAAEKQRNYIRCSFYNKKLRRLEMDAYYHDRRAPLEYYRTNLNRAIQRAMRLAYWRGRHHALSFIEQAYGNSDFPAGSRYIQWDYFHEKLIIPWAKDVKAWAAGPIEPAQGMRYRCAPDLVCSAFELAKQQRCLCI
jgi:hypothetical protein